MPVSAVHRFRVAVCDAELDPTAKLVGLVIARYMSGEGVTYVSRRTVALAAGLEIRSVVYAVQRLERVGLLTVERVSGGRWRSNLYRANGASPCTVEQRSTVHQEDSNGASGCTLRGSKGKTSAHASAPAAARTREGGERELELEPHEGQVRSEGEGPSSAREAAAAFRRRLEGGDP